MAKKLYEEENVREIANTIRDLTGDSETKYKLVNMPQGLSNVFAAGHTEGYGTGLNDGANKLKQDEARTVADVKYTVTTTDVTITVPSGYYANTENKVLDELDSLKDAQYDTGYDDGYNDGYADGYDEGLSEGSGGGIGDVEFAPLIEQANNIQSIIDLNDIDPWISDEFQRRYAFPIDTFGQVGYRFFDIVEYETSDPRSCPITVTFYNYNPRLTAHVVYTISDNAMKEYWYSIIDISPEESVSESFDSESSRGSDWVMEIIGAYFTYD